MTGRVQGKVALITGGGRGQGRSHALKLAAEGADIVAFDLCHDLKSVAYELATPDDLKQTVAEVEALDRRALGIQGDVRDLSALTDAVKADHRHVRQAGHRLRQRGHRQLRARPRDGRLGRGRRHQPGRRDEHPARDAAGDERGRLGRRHRLVRRDDQGRRRRRAGRAGLQLRQAAARRLRQVGRGRGRAAGHPGQRDSPDQRATPACCTTTASTPGSGPTWRTRPARMSCRRSPPCS